MLKVFRQVGTTDQEEALATIQERKLTKLRNLHELTHEFLRWGAIKGITVTPDGKTYANMYTEFNVTPKAVNFDFRSSNTLALLHSAVKLLDTWKITC